MSQGTDPENVERAESQLGVVLPTALRLAYETSNRALEIGTDDDGWTTFPVFDPESPARTAGHLVRENGEARRWARFPPGAIAIAEDGCGNRLVMTTDAGAASAELYAWDHETGELSRTTLTASVILEAARADATRIAALGARFPR